MGVAEGKVHSLQAEVTRKQLCMLAGERRDPCIELRTMHPLFYHRGVLQRSQENNRRGQAMRSHSGLGQISPAMER